MAVLYEERFVSAGRNELRQETLAVKGLRFEIPAVKGLSHFVLQTGTPRVSFLPAETNL